MIFSEIHLLSFCFNGPDFYVLTENQFNVIITPFIQQAKLTNEVKLPIN